MVRAGEPVQSHGCSLEKSWPRTLGRDSCGDAGGVSTDVLMGSRVQQLCPLSLEKYSFVGLILKALHGRQVLQAVGKVQVCEGGLSPLCTLSSDTRRLHTLRSGLKSQKALASQAACWSAGQSRVSPLRERLPGAWAG